ncbi:hypothetical protein [Caldinitratiruptor microaerophilus]|uniref:Uncharacterized protein n=1 Tax=Caldinitratiruptor microaerophilus TaxID=671077 RepID=A0AA35G7I6_9FIRM|nr:hypothetical protein [Caldinitratiruptor microaerophilus]BDG59915.1 hypothetical protein caldi_10050 [Caldinitratiruptor microaerophilus]
MALPASTWLDEAAAFLRDLPDLLREQDELAEWAAYRHAKGIVVSPRRDRGSVPDPTHRAAARLLAEGQRRRVALRTWSLVRGLPDEVQRLVRLTFWTAPTLPVRAAAKKAGLHPVAAARWLQQVLRSTAYILAEEVDGDGADPDGEGPGR